MRREVVSGPGSQQLRHRDWPKRPMPSAKFKFCLAQFIACRSARLAARNRANSHSNCPS